MGMSITGLYLTQWIRMFCLILLNSFNCVSSQSKGLTCRGCNDVRSPGDCKNTLLCGKGETCNLLQKPIILVGKRKSDVNPAPPGQCFQCCSTDDCNSALCPGPQVTTDVPSQTSAQTANKDYTLIYGCPQGFVLYKDHCYWFSMGYATWENAKTGCQNRGSDLVSINSLDEHEFLRQQLIMVNASYIFFYWTGGSYNHTQGEWMWADHSSFNNASVWDRSPPRYYYDREDYFATILNPAHPHYDKALLFYTQDDTEVIYLESYTQQ